jgi:hypothetical protein
MPARFIVFVFLFNDCDIVDGDMQQRLFKGLIGLYKFGIKRCIREKRLVFIHLEQG